MLGGGISTSLSSRRFAGLQKESQPLRLLRVILDRSYSPWSDYSTDTISIMTNDRRVVRSMN